MSSLKPIKLYSHTGGPNPWKVVMVMEELDVPYTSEWMDFSNIKKEPFINVNPNGRVPAIEDPNTGITIWESGAIIMYLVETYDKDHKISHTSSPEKFEEIQWAMFQMSGQGPYYGQAVWFTRFHPEKVQSAVDRYVKEIERVISVIDMHLSRRGSKEPWLVGDKCTYADIMFIPWSRVVPRLELADKFEKQYPHYDQWLARLNERPAIKKATEAQEQAQKAEA